jgi:hypothetical protein
MTTSHRADGPGSLALPGPGDLRAVFANDNASPPSVGAGVAHGVVLCAETQGDGQPFAAIRLLGAGATLSAPVHISLESWDIIALWRGLGRDLNLALYLRDASGVMTPITPLTGEIVHLRRKGSPLSGRRPRFLTRRRVPVAGHHAATPPAAVHKG